jgi:hypothetical protein
MIGIVMGFFSDLADLGKNIGGEFAQLGRELGQIAKDTKNEIADDPLKYAKESAVDIAAGATHVAKFAVNVALPGLVEAAFRQSIASFDQKLKQDLSHEEREKTLAMREKAAKSLVSAQQKNAVQEARRDLDLLDQKLKQDLSHEERDETLAKRERAAQSLTWAQRRIVEQEKIGAKDD